MSFDPHTPPDPLYQYEMHIIVLKRIIEHLHQTGFSPEADTATSFYEFLQLNGPLNISVFELQYMIPMLRMIFEKTDKDHGEKASFTNHLLERRYKLSKLIWGSPDVFGYDNLEAIFSQRIREPPLIMSTMLDDPQYINQDGYISDAEQESFRADHMDPDKKVYGGENDPYLAKDRSRKGDFQNLAILKCILVCYHNRGVFPPAESYRLYNMVKSTLKDEDLPQAELVTRIKQLEDKFKEYTDQEIMELDDPGLHEIFQLSKKIWGNDHEGTPRNRADERGDDAENKVDELEDGAKGKRKRSKLNDELEDDAENKVDDREDDAEGKRKR